MAIRLPRTPHVVVEEMEVIPPGRLAHERADALLRELFEQLFTIAGVFPDQITSTLYRILDTSRFGHHWRDALLWQELLKLEGIKMLPPNHITHFVAWIQAAEKAWLATLIPEARWMGATESMSTIEAILIGWLRPPALEYEIIDLVEPLHPFPLGETEQLLLGKSYNPVQFQVRFRDRHYRSAYDQARYAGECLQKMDSLTPETFAKQVREQIDETDCALFDLMRHLLPVHHASLFRIVLLLRHWLQTLNAFNAVAAWRSYSIDGLLPGDAFAAAIAQAYQADVL